MLTREQILSAAPALPMSEFDVPEWGGKVLLRVLPASEKDSYEMWIADTKERSGMKGLANYKSRLVAKCLVDEQGKRLFSDQQVEELAKQPGHVIDSLFAECSKLNRMGGGAIQEAAKNSESAPVDGSPTG